MTFGEKLKELREKIGLTQLDLADKLNVTYQAVSRWENDNVEPSIATIKQMAEIFNCSIDELLGQETKQEEKVEESVQPVKQVLTICEECNKPLYVQEDIHRWSYKHSTRHGRSHHTETRSKVLCKECYDKHVKEKEEQKKFIEQNRLSEIKKKRVHSFIWPSVAFAVMLLFAIICFTSTDQEVVEGGWFYIYCGVTLFTFIACLIFNNNFIGEMWLEIASWGFVKLPGVIFEFSFDGIITGLIIKAILWLLGFALALLSVLFATALGSFLSVFVYPFALINNLKNKD